MGERKKRIAAQRLSVCLVCVANEEGDDKKWL